MAWSIFSRTRSDTGEFTKGSLPSVESVVLLGERCA
jgi:hypothetical protein